jgi:hypothetical protein
MLPKKYLLSVFAAVASLTLGYARPAASAVRLTVGPDAARPLTLAIGDRDVRLSGDGGFRVYDATTKSAVALPQGKVSGSGKSIAFETKTPEANVAISARFEQKDGYVLVTGEVVNQRGDERGFIVDYRLPRLAPDAVFSYHLEQSVPMDRTTETENTALPLGAMSAGDTGIAMAIPPTDPRVFGLAADATGLSMRFYLGTSPLPRKFPNKATFAFIIYGIEPAWGFRSALSRYYGFYPEYYVQRLKKEGIFMFQMVDRMPSNVDQYGFNLSEPQWTEEQIARALERDEKNNIATFPYMIVGQREVKFLPALPKNYQEAMDIYSKWTLADHGVRPLLKEAAAAQGDLFLKEEVDNSGVIGAEGRKVIVVRDTLWGQKSVTFKINPNPDLFADENRRTTGAMALQLTAKWIKMHPEYDGMFVDSMGANWPAVLNYRPDHFTYARYPLTFDPDGKVALQNDISHYEYIESLRKLLRASNRLVLANGVYIYTSRGTNRPTKASAGIEQQTVSTMFNEFLATAAPPEHYRAGARIGRFFDSALFDVASSEFGVKATLEQCRDERVLLGRKPYAFLNYHWEEQEKINDFVNRCLSYGIFASTSTNFFSGVIYELHPNGYLRDKPLLDWYVPLVRTLSKAGWEPVRYAKLEGQSLAAERFGSGSTVYYTLFNDSDKPQVGTLSIDLAALGFDPAKASIKEIGRQTKLEPKAGAVTLTLEPKKCYVIQVSKS